MPCAGERLEDALDARRIHHSARLSTIHYPGAPRLEAFLDVTGKPRKELIDKFLAKMGFPGGLRCNRLWDSRM